MNRDTALRLIHAVADECLPEDLTARVMADDAFTEKHYDGLIAAVSAVDPDGENEEAAANSAAEYAAVIREDLKSRHRSEFSYTE